MSFKHIKMALTNGFIELLLKEKATNITPVLVVEAKCPDSSAWILSDGDRTYKFLFKTGSGPVENVHVGARLVLFEFYLTANKGQYKRCMIQRFEIYTLPMLTNTTPKTKQKPSQSSASSTSQITLFPQLVPEITVQTRICPQSSWLIGRIGRYMHQYFANVTHSPGRPPIVQSSSEVGNLVLFRNIRRYREMGAALFFMDETWLWSGMKKEFEWICQKVKADPLKARKEFHTTGPIPSTSRGNRAIVVGAMSEQKIVMDSCRIFRGGVNEDGDYHRQMNASIFEKWLVETIPCLLREAGNRRAVLVLDNAPYHTRRIEKVPTKSATKQTMIDFLEKNGYHPSAGLRKPGLYESLRTFVQNNPQNGDKRAVEELCKNSGLEVLFLPPYHCILNPIELIWSNFKRQIRDKATSKSKIQDVIDLGMESLATISEQTIINCSRHVLDLEQWFLDQEGLRDYNTPFIIPLDDDDFEEWGQESEEETDDEAELNVCD